MSCMGISLTKEASPQYNDVTSPLFIQNEVMYGPGWSPGTDNHHCVNFAELSKGEIVWKNPRACSIFKPFIIPKFDRFANQQLAEKCGVNLETGEDHYSGAKFALEPMIDSMVMLDPKDLASLSQVSIRCYLATKTNAIWEAQFTKFFPEIKPLRESFSTEWQFKIYFKRMVDEMQIYKCQFKHNQKVWKKSNKVKNITIELFGANYNGTKETIDPSSQQGRCLLAITTGVPDAFNDQDKLDKMMDRARIINANTPEETQDPFRNKILVVMNSQFDAPGRECVIL